MKATFIYAGVIRVEAIDDPEGYRAGEEPRSLKVRVA